MSRRDRLETMAFAAFVVSALVFAVVLAVHLYGQARLVGYGCDGTEGPVYGGHETDLLRCEIIRPRI